MVASAEHVFNHLEHFLSIATELKTKLDEGCGDVLFTPVQERLLTQLNELVDLYARAAKKDGFLKDHSKFTTAITDILNALSHTNPSSKQHYHLDSIKKKCTELLSVAVKVAEKKIASCFVVDAWTGGIDAAILPLIPLMRTNLSLFIGTTLERLRVTGGYSDEDKFLVQSFVKLIKTEPVDEITRKELKTTFKEFKNHPLAFALLTDLINHGGGPGKRPPNKIILHCDIGDQTEDNLSHIGTLTAYDVQITTPSQLKKLRENFKAHLKEVAGNELEVLYIGLGHGGDIEGSHNLRKQMSGIAGTEWTDALTYLARQETQAHYIVSESCYSAAFSKELHSLLTPDGVMQVEALECTPVGGLAASVKKAAHPEEEFYSTLEIEQVEDMAMDFLAKLGKDASDIGLVSRTTEGLLSVLKDKDSSQLTGDELNASPILKELLDESAASEYTQDQVIAVSGYLPPTFDLWSYYDKETMKPLDVTSINSFKDYVNTELQSGGVSTTDAIKLSALYVETTRAYMSMLFGKPQNKIEELIGNPYPNRLAEEALTIGCGYASFEKIVPHVTLVSNQSDSVNKALEVLNSLRAASTSKIIMSKDEIYIPLLITKPENAAESDWKIRLKINTQLAMQSFAEGEKNVRLLDGGQREALALVNKLASAAKEPIITHSS